MNKIFSQHVCFLLSLAATAVVGSGLSAQAETIDTVSTDREEAATFKLAPVPGTMATIAAPLKREESATPSLAPGVETGAPTVAQVDLDPDIPSLPGSSYIGIAGNIGLDGTTALGDGTFAVISKIGLTNNISVRPSALLGDDTAFLIPATYDISILPIDAFEEALSLSPYIGGGVIITTGDEDEVGPLVTAGVDFGLTPQFTATAAVNVGFLDDSADIGLLIGVGYNFAGLGL